MKNATKGYGTLKGAFADLCSVSNVVEERTCKVG